MTRVLRAACNCLVVAVLLASFGVLAVFGIPMLRGMRIYAVLTGSMDPTYPVGSVVVVEPVAAEQIATGDVITFHLAGFESPVTHRVLEVDSEKRQFLTKGDNNRSADFSPIPFESLQGRVAFGIPYVGGVITKLRTPAGFLMVLWGFLGLTALLFLPDVAEHIRMRRQQKEKELMELQIKIWRQQRQMNQRSTRFR